MQVAGGRAYLPRIPPGTYTLQTWSQGGPERMRIEVRGPTEVTFQGAVINALAITILDPTGGLARAGFQTGDLIVALGGQEFEGMQQMQMLFMSAMSSGEPATLTVERAGNRREVVFDVAEFMDPAAMGGSMEPSTR